MVHLPGIFPTFLLSGFECSTFLWKDQGRRDLVEETRHRQHADEDYGILRRLGIAVSREGVPWPLVERGGEYDFALLDPIIEAMNRQQIIAIWDLCHYGYPDGADPLRRTSLHVSHVTVGQPPSTSRLGCTDHGSLLP